MTKGLYGVYKETRKLLEEAETRNFSGDHELRRRIQRLFNEWRVSVEKMELLYPDYTGKYDEECRVQRSFSAEQKDFIDWQINDWYREWKNRIVADSEVGRFKFDVAKDQLKIMIFGD